MKFADVLIMLTRTVEEARVRARVKRPHMMALKRRFMPKKSWLWRQYFVARVGATGARDETYTSDCIFNKFIRCTETKGYGDGARP